jgi:hypothetical protein
MEKILKNKIKEKIILDKEHQNIIAALNQKIESLEQQLLECQNVETQHKKMNGLLYKEVDDLKKEIFQIKKENLIYKENLQAELLRSKLPK